MLWNFVSDYCNDSSNFKLFYMHRKVRSDPINGELNFLILSVHSVSKIDRF